MSSTKPPKSIQHPEKKGYRAAYCNVGGIEKTYKVAISCPYLVIASKTIEIKAPSFEEACKIAETSSAYKELADIDFQTVSGDRIFRKLDIESGYALREAEMMLLHKDPVNRLSENEKEALKGKKLIPYIGSGEGYHLKTTINSLVPDNSYIPPVKPLPSMPEFDIEDLDVFGLEHLIRMIKEKRIPDSLRSLYSQAIKLKRQKERRRENTPPDLGTARRLARSISRHTRTQHTGIVHDLTVSTSPPSTEESWMDPIGITRNSNGTIPAATQTIELTSELHEALRRRVEQEWASLGGTDSVVSSGITTVPMAEGQNTYFTGGLNPDGSPEILA